MIKLIRSDSFWDNPSAILKTSEPSVQILRRNSILVKSASVLSEYVSKVKPTPGRTKLLILALGANEYWGCNKNGDAFSDDILRKYHNTFVESGHVFKHHINKDPEKSYGKVEFSYFNPIMHRVELVADVDNSQCVEELSKLENGEDVPVSMACRVSYDICSICGHKSRRVEEYCEHLKNDIAKIYDDGRQVCAINPDPRFFDISFVWMPADRTAYVLRKVASERVVPSAVLAKMAGYKDDMDAISINKFSLDKKSLLKKLSEIEKVVDGLVAGKSPETKDEEFLSSEAPKAFSLETCIPEDAMSSLKKAPLNSSMASLAKDNISLDIGELANLLLGDKPGLSSLVDEAKSLLPGIFSRLTDDDVDMSDSFDFEPSDSSGGIRRLLEKIVGNRSLGEGPSNGRILAVTIRQIPVKKLMLGDNSVGMSSSSGGSRVVVKTSNYKAAEKLAKCYALYKLATIANEPSCQTGRFMALSIVQNYLK